MKVIRILNTVIHNYSLAVQVDMRHPALAPLLDPVVELYEDVRKKALMRLEYEGLSKCEAVTSEGARWNKDPAG